MILFSLIFATHIDPSLYLRCKDYHWLKQGMYESELFTPLEKFDFITHWMNHTDPKCFEDKK
jgi:hypothetical protein